MKKLTEIIFLICFFGILLIAVFLSVNKETQTLSGVSFGKYATHNGNTNFNALSALILAALLAIFYFIFKNDLKKGRNNAFNN